MVTGQACGLLWEEDKVFFWGRFAEMNNNWETCREVKNQ